MKLRFYRLELGLTWVLFLLGISETCRSAFVLVAGGLGERLGYSGIKVALPTELVTGRSFLQLYIESILACQKKGQSISDPECKIPFVVMTSDDTHDQTENYLRTNNYFGLMRDQVLRCCAVNEWMTG